MKPKPLATLFAGVTVGATVAGLVGHYLYPLHAVMEETQLGFLTDAEAAQTIMDYSTSLSPLSQYIERHKEQRHELERKELVPFYYNKLAVPIPSPGKSVFANLVPGLWHSANGAVKSVVGLFNGGQASVGDVSIPGNKQSSARNALQLGSGSNQNTAGVVVHFDSDEHDSEGGDLSPPTTTFVQSHMSFASYYPSRRYPLWQSTAYNSNYETMYLLSNSNAGPPISGVHNITWPAEDHKIMERIHYLQEFLSKQPEATCCSAPPRFSSVGLNLRVPLSPHQDKREISIFNNHL